MSVHSREIIKPALDVVQYAEAENVPYNTLTTVLSYTAPADTKIALISCSGEDYAKFQIFIDTDLKGTKRGGPHRNVEWNFNHPLLLSQGELLEIKVTHWFNGDALDFEAGIYAYS
jgi:hypothetical protein